MSDLLAARSQMAMSLAFHIVFAVVGIGMPLLMVIAERRWHKTGERVYLVLAKRWAKGTALMFAVGAVSGTVLSFELGLLWPEFMAHAGAVIGMPFSLEGFAFFLEAIFLGIYLYGWRRVPHRIHWLSGVMVFICGSLSAVFVIMANGWMNAPTGFTVAPDGRFVDIDPFAAMFNTAAFTQIVHMLLAAFVAIGFAVAAVHAFMLLRDRDNPFHRKALSIALTIGAISAVLQPVSGDLSAKMVAETQPAKLAAMEGHWQTERGAPLRLLGWPDEEAEETRWAIEIPYLFSILAYGDPHAEVMGLSDLPADERPPVAIVHIAFQIMVLAGLFMAAVGLLGGWLAWRRRERLMSRWYLKLVIACGPLGFIAIEAGWTVTEVGRQPWIIQGLMRTRDAVTPMPNLVVPFLTFTLLYCLLAVVVIVLMRRLVFASPLAAELTEPDLEGG